MPLNEKKFTAILQKIRDASRRTIIPSIHDLFTYLETEVPSNVVFRRYEDERKTKWEGWIEGRSIGSWEMPLNEADRKSLAYDLYRGVVESGDAGNGTIFWMYHEDWETNVLEFQRDFFDPFVNAMDDIYSSAQAAPSDAILSEVKKVSKDVFVVHGHDEMAKLRVQNFLHRLGLTPIVLHEQVNQGSTIIEKLERESKRVQFAIILLTPDDKGCAARETDLVPRTRQNIIFEWGLFVGLLGRSNVCALRVGSVEIPSDMHGVVWESMDGPWEAKVAKEMRAAGLDVDLNNV